MSAARFISSAVRATLRVLAMPAAPVPGALFDSITGNFDDQPGNFDDL